MISNREEIFKFLDQLRETNVSLMLDAVSHVQKEFGLDRNEARIILQDWMKRKISAKDM